MCSAQRLRLLAAVIGFSTLAWNSVSATVTLDYNTIVFTQNSYFHGVNCVGMWDPNWGSTGSQKALKAAGCQIVRFPGGDPGDNYDWNNGRGDTTPMQASNYAKAIGAKLLFQTNWRGAGCTGCNSATSVAQWVTYCKNNNIDVPLWEIGNEPDINVGAGGTTATDTLNQYFSVFNSQAPAMKAANAAIKIMGPASTNTTYWGSAYGPNTVNKFVQACSTNADGYSIHWYKTGGVGLTGSARWDVVKSSAYDFMNDTRNLFRGKTKPFYVTEWSCIGPAMTDAAGSFSQSIGLALANADVIGAMSKTKVAGETMFGCIHGVEDNWGMLYSSTSTDGFLDDVAPMYYVLALWTKMGDQVLNCSPGADSVNILSTWAHKKSSNSHLTVMLINKTTSASSQTINLGYTPKSSAVTIYELRDANGQIDDFGSAPDDIYYNNVAGGSITPSSGTLPAPLTATISGSSFVRNLPALSVTVLDFDGKSTGVSNSLRSPASPAQITKEFMGGVGMVTVTLQTAIADENPDISVYSMSGKKLERLTRSGVATYRWNSGSFAAGTYLIKVSGKFGTLMENVVLTK